jgi:HEAT repeat protein
VPILQRVLERRDACSVKLRRRAVWLISQQHTADATSLLLDVARNDPDREVQEQAVFWLSQVHSDEAVNALDSILMESDDQKIQEKAIFLLSQHDSPRAAAILRRYVERTDAPEKLRENAIFWLGQSDRGENQEFLRELYGRVTSEGLKDKIIFGLSQHGSEEAAAFLLEIALNRAESIKLRKSALFWAGQTEEIPAERLDELYDSIDGREMREQVIFVLSQRHEREAVDALMNIATNEPDRELKKKAIFWLGQSKDPRVAEFLLQLINEPPR